VRGRLFSYPQSVQPWTSALTSSVGPSHQEQGRPVSTRSNPHPGAAQAGHLPVLVKKPGALRNGAPFKDWDLPPGLTEVRVRLKSHADGDRQFVKVLSAVLDHGLDAVEAACAEALAAGIASGDVILTVLARQRQPAAPPSITTPDALRLKIEPMADCGRYDSIRKVA